MSNETHLGYRNERDKRMESAAKRLLHKGGSDRKCDGIQASVAGRLCACLQICESDMTIHTQLSAVLALSEKITGHFAKWGCVPSHDMDAFNHMAFDLIRQHGKDLLAMVEGWTTVEPSREPMYQSYHAMVDDQLRIVKFGKTSHVPIYGWCLADQGVEDFDICQPTAWHPFPAAMTKGSAE